MSYLSSHQASDKEAWSLDQWLIYLEQIHPSNIELGLQRIAEVFLRMQLDLSQRTVITVAGTNGKGTTCALIEQALLIAKHSVAVFSSPHLLDYRERVRVAGDMLSEKAHCLAFLKVDQARGDTLLTYFEFGTLAALQLMADSDAKYLLLEVGLGGRLDSVNIVDPNIAVITSIDLDHQDWLGDTKELIAVEKAGIFRANIPAVIGEPNPPSTLVTAALDYKVKPVWQGSDFEFQIDEKGFHWKGVVGRYDNLPVPSIPAQNASTALQVIEMLGLQLDHQQMTQVFSQTSLPGRRQVIQTKPTVMLDVAHNPHATKLLAFDLNNTQYKNVIAVVAMLADKDIEATLAPMSSVVSHWFCGSLDVPRGAPSSTLVSAVLSFGQKVLDYDSVEVAYKSALEKAEEDDLVIVFGSFFTVTKILEMGPLTPHEKV
ncbi:bifunctional tetrahydrofolate synthase/dihydrofolate synthase [uncultured Paraglaciecola sp.]|jgi:dihydrofolate synthase / folylpolyglutamate synthase|uniref:bifunctional tetrahydrofolate synthase/dihydrofolate synthase n=1 Tax=uncultured Paraglaciecola sp. TaxID=1765024 RepID=UPI0025F1A503|nr:bifunctional tetrahydrofolate synthase/dihydrofolate synthase [uncultured Paraglaciecola sp.]